MTDTFSLEDSRADGIAANLPLACAAGVGDQHMSATDNVIHGGEGVRVKARVAVFADLFIEVPEGTSVPRQRLLDELPGVLRLEHAPLALCVEFTENEVAGLTVAGRHEHGEIQLAQVYDIQIARVQKA